MRWTRIKAPTDAEYRRLLAGAKRMDPVAWALFYVVGHLGLRVGEAAMIRGTDFEWDEGRALVPTEKKRNETAPRWEVYFNAETGKTLREAVAVALAKRPPEDRVFPVTKRTLQNVWRRHADRVGLGHLGIHALRHWFGVATYRGTRDIVFTRDQMRHTDVGTTQIYARVVDHSERAKKVSGL